MRAILISLLFVTSSFGADAPAQPTIAPGIRESQVTLLLERAGKRTQLQATVIAKGATSLTVMTAGHGLGPADLGVPLRIRARDRMIAGRVEAVTRNPNYRAAPSGDIPGADNAVARFRLDAADAPAPDFLQIAEVAGWAIPEPSGSALTIQTIDQFHVPHVVKAGNYTNPRWLEWGPNYRPVPGDSGSGVFVVRLRPDGSAGPVLIGVVVDRSERGGGAALVHRKDGWVNAAIKNLGTKK
ncbi:MAG: hypothetical protein JWN86_1095 [Planctomycetota bacterium]|nr:hypothetical protein [Planctomycetota bacterium]